MSALNYPFPEVPAAGETIEIQPGILWARMAMPIALDHINVYLIEDEEGWWIVDTGLSNRQTRASWEQIFAESLGGKPVVGLICTHMHPDHIGLASWITERWRISLWMSQREYIGARVLSGPHTGASRWAEEEYYLRIGVPAEFIQRFFSKGHGFSALVAPMPGTYRRLSDGDSLKIGGSVYQVVVGYGHSPEHACLHCEERGILFSGDQVIPRITSNISVMAQEPEANPLKDWMASLERFLQLPANTLSLPSHNTPFLGLHTRLQELIEHHNDHLLALEEVCVQSRTVADLLPVLFKRELDESQRMLAMSECIAHLNLLRSRGQMQRSIGEDGLFHYTTTDPELETIYQPEKHYVEDAPIMQYEGDPI